MAQQATVRVHGLNDLIRDFGKLQPELRREVQRELQKVAEIVAVEARQRAGRYGARTVQGIRPRVRARSLAVVEQNRRKVTGLRPDFGSLLMRKVFIAALFAKEHEVEEAMEDVIDRLASDHGLGRGGTL